MTKFVVRLVGEDSARTFETLGESETLAGAAEQLVDLGYLLGRMKTSERTPEPQEVAIIASQVKWITHAPARQAM